MRFRNEKAVIFDFNGTMYFDKEINDIAWLAIINELSSERVEDLNAFSKGMATYQDTQFARSILRKLDLSCDDEAIRNVWTRKEEIYIALAKERKMFSLVPGLPEYLDQLKYRHFYFTEYEYEINSINFTSYNPLTKKADALVNFDLTFKLPEDPAATILLDRLEKVTLLKEKIGWKIDNIEEVKDSGRKIAPQLVNDIFHALEARKNAISSGDFQLFESVVHPDFASRNELLSDFRKNAEVFSDINYGLKSRKLLSVSADEKNAEVLQYFDLSFKTKDGNVSEKIENQKEVISLKKSDDGTWKIIGGLR